MKKLALAAAFTAAASTAFAGSHGAKYEDPIIEPEIIIEETKKKGTAGIVVPLMLLVLVAAAVAAK